MTQELDSTDLLILQELQNDGHLTIKELAQRVHLSVSPVYERVRRLERSGYIKGYVAVLDAEKLDCGFVVFCYLKMKQHTHENAVQIMERVQKIPEIVEVYNISGDFDFLLKICAQHEAVSEFCDAHSRRYSCHRFPELVVCTGRGEKLPSPAVASRRTVGRCVGV